VSYHATADLGRFLVSWRDYCDVTARLAVVLVDATPTEQIDTDKLCELGAVHHLITYDSNVGYAISCNYAAQLLDSDFFLFLNADTELRPGVLSSCLETLRSDPGYAVVGPRQLDSNGCITHAGIFNVKKPTHRGFLEPDHRPSLYADIRTDCITVSGSAYMVKRSVWEELTTCETYQACFPGAIGAFAPMKLMYEETTASYHARAHGYQIVYDGRCPMIHQWHATARQYPTYVQQCLAESRELFRAFCKAHEIENEFDPHA